MPSPTSGSSRSLADLFAAYRAGEVSRRHVVMSAIAMGMAAPAALACAQAVSAQTPQASPAAIASPAGRPDAGTDGQTRGEGGDLRLLQWQAVSTLSPHTSSGIKDTLGSTPVLEPLMGYLPDGSLTPILITEVPTVANGLLAADSTSVTYTLLPDVTWSDGTPFTANDVRFTWQWISDETNNSISIGYYSAIADVVVVDDLTVRVEFTDVTPAWFLPFTGSDIGPIYPAHILQDDPAAIDAFAMAPIGTGPYVVESFAVDDQIVYAMNETYREPNKPFFSRVILKGGGDAASAARAVFQTGEYDFAWNLAIEPEVLAEITTGANGTLFVSPTTNTERLHFNFSDPDTEVDGQRSEVNTPHPFLTDPTVREAISMAIDRQTIAAEFYLGGDDEPATNNVLAGIPSLESPNTSFTFDPEAAAVLLDEAGWVLDGDIRAKDGVQLSVRYISNVDSVRQKIQALVKANLEDIGIAVELVQVPPGIFFDVTPGNDQSITKFYGDFQQAFSGAESMHPVGFMQQWYAGEDNWNIPQASNEWLANNFQRYVNPEYDALLDEVTVDPDPVSAAETFIALNDMLVRDNVCVTMVNLSEKNAAATWLNPENFAFGPFSNAYWNIANWNRVAEEPIA